MGASLVLSGVQGQLVERLLAEVTRHEQEQQRAITQLQQEIAELLRLVAQREPNFVPTHLQRQPDGTWLLLAAEVKDDGGI